MLNESETDYMQPDVELKGMYCALVTPLHEGRIQIDALQNHVQTMIDEGMDGLLLLGTTGEGPSLSLKDRDLTLKSVLEVSRNLKIMVGTGTPSLADTIESSYHAFELGAEAVVVVPPYYFKNLSEDGLFQYFKAVMDQGVPDGKQMLLYIIPKLTGIPVSTALLTRLFEYGQGKFSGIKDSTGDIAHAREVIAALPDLRVFVGTEALLKEGLRSGAVGCITAGANVLGHLAVQVYQAEQSGDQTSADDLQRRLSTARSILDSFPPNPPMLKYLLERRYGGIGWQVCPPLTAMSEERGEQLYRSLKSLDYPELQWL